MSMVVSVLAIWVIGVMALTYLTARFWRDPPAIIGVVIATWPIGIPCFLIVAIPAALGFYNRSETTNPPVTKEK